MNTLEIPNLYDHNYPLEIGGYILSRSEVYSIRINQVMFTLFDLHDLEIIDECVMLMEMNLIVELRNLSNDHRVHATDSMGRLVFSNAPNTFGTAKFIEITPVKVMTEIRRRQLQDNANT